MRIGLAQLNSRQDKSANLAAAGDAIDRLATAGVDLVLLPEMFNHLGSDADNALAAETIPGPSSEWARDKAREYGLFVHCGSMIERRGDMLLNTSIVYDRAGDEAARYSKIHLFDVRLPDGTTYMESQAITPGHEVVVFPCEGVTVGLSICYDLRFPQLFHALADRGAQVLLVPAAFTVFTGISHWEPLLRARAIENGCYVAACGQWGRSEPGNHCYGHSMVVDPWGVVIAQCREGIGTVSAELDLEYLHSVRERMPVQRHRRRDLFG
ncbi:MAG: carbon-nitrogen hydrolase family protein [bacterium]